MEGRYSKQQEYLARGYILPAAIAIAAAYKATGSLDGNSQALESELIGYCQTRWNDYYSSGGLHSLPDDESGGIATFVKYNLKGIFPKERQGSFTDEERNTLLKQVADSLRCLLSTGRKPNDDKLHKQMLRGQQRAMGELIHRLAVNDLDDWSASCFLRRRDIPVLQQIVMGSGGRQRPLLSYLEPEDWETILRLWTRGWQPTVKALETRIAARIDGVPCGGALDQVTSY